MHLIRCTAYCSITGILGFLAGRVLPKNWLNPHKGLFRCFPFEKGGKIYEKLGIHRWQNKVPDMSRILPFAMPPKGLEGDFAPRLPDMICETCIAELVHLLLCISGLYCLKLWPGIGGVSVTIFYILVLNLPFVLIQRYNRPRLIRLQKRLGIYARKKKETICAH